MSQPVDCPLCRAEATRHGVVSQRVYGSDSEHVVYHCGSCDVRYLHPGLSAEEEKRLYTSEFEEFMAERSSEHSGWELPERHVEANAPQYARRMKYLEKYLTGTQRILEVGCSSGFMLYPLVEQGHACTAVEPSGVFAEYVRSRGIPCYDSIQQLSADRAGGQFDLIMHFFVMEHIRDPAGFLGEQLALLAPGGRIVFEIPHANDALTAIYRIQAYERFIWVVSHHWYFSEASLGFLLRRAGARHEIFQDQRYDLSNHIIWARDGKPGGMGRFTPTIGPDIEGAYREALVKAGHGDTLIGVIFT